MQLRSKLTLLSTAFTLCVALQHAAPFTGTARAQDLPRVCNPKKEDCGCERNWGCWELLYTTKGTILGIKGTFSRSSDGTHDAADGGIVTSYFTEHFGTKPGLAGHFLAYGTIGGGSASTEGSLGGEADFGLRLDLTKTSGAFLRVGPSGMLLGNQQLHLGIFSPAQTRVGFQALDGDDLFEWGVTLAMSLAGRYEAVDVNRELGRALQLGSYFVLHTSSLRVEASLKQLASTSAVDGNGVWLAHAALCTYLRPVAVCIDALGLSGDAHTRAGEHRALRSLYAGLGVGLTP